MRTRTYSQALAPFPPYTASVCQHLTRWRSESFEKDRYIKKERPLPLASLLDLPFIRGRIIHHYRVRALPYDRAGFHLPLCARLSQPDAGKITLQRTNVFHAHWWKSLHLTCPPENHEEKRCELVFLSPPPLTLLHHLLLTVLLSGRCAGTDGVNLPLRCSPIGRDSVMLRPLPGRCPTGCGAGAPSGGWYRISGSARVARTGDAAAAVSRTSRRHTGTAAMAMACSIKSGHLIASAQLLMTPVVTPQAWPGRMHAHRDGRCSPSLLIQLIIQNQSLWWFFTRAPYCYLCRNKAPCIWKTF